MSLEISECDKAALEGSADCLTSICRTELPEDVVKVSLDRRRCEREVLGHSLRSVALGDSSEDLHFPRCERGDVTSR